MLSGSLQCVVTSPPYWGLRDYGVDGQIGLEETLEQYVANMVGVFAEVRRILRDDGTLWLNLGDSYTSGGRPTYRSGASDNKGHLIQNDMVRPLMPGGLKPKDLVGIPWRVAFALQADGWYLRSDIIWHKPNPMPESVTDRPTKSHEYIFLFSKSDRYFYDAEAIREPGAEKIGTEKHLRAGNGERAGSREGLRGQGWGNYRNKRSVWTIATQPYAEAHFATFPEEIPKLCLLAGSKLGDRILDPFAGSGTTGKVATELGRKFIGIELNGAYCNLAHTRMQTTLGML